MFNTPISIKYVRILYCTLAFIVLYFFSSVVNASFLQQLSFDKSKPVPVQQAFVFEAQQLNSNQLKLSWKMPKGYYLYRDRMTIEPAVNIELVQRFNVAAEEKDDSLFGQVWVYYEQAQVDLVLSSLKETPVDSHITISYQGCWQGGICYPAVTEKIPLNKISQFDGKSANIVVTEQDRFAYILADYHFSLALIIFFCTGLLLSLTPCMLPMYPILSSLIAGRGSQINSKKGFVLSLVYVLAMAVAYALLGVLAGSFGENLQAYLQNTWVIGLTAVFFVLLAFNLFGFYSLSLPSAMQSGLSRFSAEQADGSLVGSASMGFTSALVVSPCMVAPLAGVLIYIGQQGDAVLGAVALFSLSLGMGVPLLILGLSAGKLLPKLGPWMEVIQRLFAFVFLFFTLWLLDRILPSSIILSLTALLLVILSIYCWRLGKTWIVTICSVGLVLYALILSFGAYQGRTSVLYPLTESFVVKEKVVLPFIEVRTLDKLEQELAAAKAAQKPVLLDFYADWCVSCLELETYTFADPKVQKLLKEFVLIKVDVTEHNDAARALYKEYKIQGPPALILYNKAGQVQSDKILIGVLSPEYFAKQLKAVLNIKALML